MKNLNKYTIEAITTRGGLNRGRKTTKVEFGVVRGDNHRFIATYNQMLVLVKTGKTVGIKPEVQKAVKTLAPRIVERIKNAA